MKLINKSSVFGFIFGAIISPLIIAGGLYLYILNIQKQVSQFEVGGEEIFFPAPEIPVQSDVDLNWNLKTTDGGQINVEEAYKDKVVFINFWATWCTPCIAEMPTIEKLYKKFNGKIGFACISNESLETINEFKNINKYTFPMYRMETEIPKAFKVTGIPVTFIISRDRKIALKHVGGADWSHEKVISYINELIDKKSQLSALGFKGYGFWVLGSKIQSVGLRGARCGFRVAGSAVRVIWISNFVRPRTRPLPRHRYTTIDSEDDKEDDKSKTGFPQIGES